ncbi:phosphopantetheine-binding protein [Halodesulfurarchaeum sp. HSR-GB]|uniref:acyl carrier protein n=1 Tax=Halodesulfurarchaeum sp. HSR-GB TaxID=3074077 RepID=UPI00285B6BCB|nr:phosphopantetheine-binding protein [Halodesulfurarchaeum sp. HSR-GB]MDR5657593.1 phosphopantetheine-binding protein [Halodesulfurarchaeum sp. HSR-GB]
MSASDIQEKTVEIVAEIFAEPPESIDRSTDFIADLHAKSMDIIALVAALEDEFEIPISVSEVQDNRTVGAAVDWLEANVEDPPG